MSEDSFLLAAGVALAVYLIGRHALRAPAAGPPVPQWLAQQGFIYDPVIDGYKRTTPAGVSEFYI